MECGDINGHSWSGVIMKSTCSSHNSHDINDCQTVQQLNMTLQKELPVFDWKHNVSYRSIACARCNNAGNLSFWGLDISCKVSSGPISAPGNITVVKRFLKEHPDCSWKYAPKQNVMKRHRACVIHDSRCASNQLQVFPVLTELCSSYAMVFSVGSKLMYRNPHCALCNPDGRPKIINNFRPPFPPLSILLDVSANIPDPPEPNTPQPTLITEPASQSFNLTSPVSNCTTTMNNCTVIFGGNTCENFTSSKNQSRQMNVFLNESLVILMTTKQISYDKNAMKLQGNYVYIMCPERQGRHTDQKSTKEPKDDFSVLIYITLIGTLLSIVSLCFLLTVYLSFQELRNLPGKCLTNLSVALLFYQAIFLSAEKSTEVDALCKAVAIFLHFFILATFSWMSIMAFDTANTFTVQGK